MTILPKPWLIAERQHRRIDRNVSRNPSGLATAAAGAAYSLINLVTDGFPGSRWR